MNGVNDRTFLSREFIAGLFVQTVIFLILGGIAWGNLKAEVTALQKNQDIADASQERITRIEEQLKAVSYRQVEFKGDIKELVTAVYELKAEIQRDRK